MLWALRFFTFFLLIFTFAPIIPWRQWWIRVFDYPKSQKFVFLFLCFIAWGVIGLDHLTIENSAWLIVTFVTLSYLGAQILTFTPAGKKMIKKVPFNEKRGIHIIVSNVYQPNNEYGEALKMAQDEKPDILFFVETDETWKTHLSELEETYPFKILIPRDNTYGMLFYSKLEIARYEIHYLIDDEIPSIEADLILTGGEKITLFGIHPTPPVPSENESSTDRDAEILIVGKKAKSSQLPCLVIGDLNDVAWSTTTELFLKISGLSDPRRGRGFFNTFHAKYFFLRWPLDHVFLSKHFGLSEMNVLTSINSDHFPISIKATLCENKTAMPIQAVKEEQALTEEKIQDAKD